MSRGKARVDRIRSDVSTHKLLMDYGYPLRGDAGDHEEQFPCDLHGGHDNTPSARFYPSSNSWHCVDMRERVLTARGWVELGRLSEETELPVLDGASDWRVPVAYLPRGEREVVRVKTKAGYEVTVTPDHEVDIVGRGWIRADEIRPGDVVIIQRPKKPSFGQDTGIDARQHRHRNHEEGVPDVIWSASEREIKGYLRLLFDWSGVISQSSKSFSIILWSSARKLLCELQLLLLQQGICSKIVIRKGRERALAISAGRDVVLFQERIGSDQLNRTLLLHAYEFKSKHERPFKTTVESVTPVGVATVADISMPVEHSFVAGGIKVHNCFGCGRTRDAIQTVVEKEGVEFWEAVRLLEKKFRLPQLPWDADVARPMNMTDVVHDALKERETVEEVSARAERMLFFMKRDGDCDHVKLLRMWEAHDRILYGHRREGWKEDQTVRLLTQLIERITDAQDSQG